MEYILEIPNSISKHKCKEIIRRFEDDTRKTPGVAGTPSTVQPVKKSLDLPISGVEHWNDIDQYLKEQLQKGIKQYRNHLKDDLSYSGVEHAFSHESNVRDTGYQIQKTVIGEYYSWHDDSMMADGRFLTFLWYLTSHDPMDHGGGTAFHPMNGGGKVVAPRRGTLLMFPATWTYAHMGLPLYLGDPKYICTGWLCSDTT